MRWQFIDQKNLPEAAERNAAIERIESWWREFQAKTDDIKSLFSQKSRWDLPDWMELHLGAIHPNLMWEFGPAQHSDGHRLVITSESRRHLRPLVRAVLERAPAIEGWEFYGFRLSDDLEHTQRNVAVRIDCDIEDFTVRASRGDGNRIDLHFAAPSIDSPEDRTAFEAAFIATQSLLGEECLNNWIGAIEISTWPLPKGLEPLEPEGEKVTPHFVGLDRLRENVDALVGNIEEQLPSTPHFQWGEDTRWTMWELDPEQFDDYCKQDDLFVGKSVNPLQWTAAHSRQPFYSKRFSRCGETFCYVKVDGSEGMNEEGFADKSDIEDALNEVLRPLKLGCYIGGGTGLRYSYIDLAVTNVDQAIQVVRSTLQAGKVPKRSWIQFYDSDLAAEWVGIYDDTPPPPMLWDS